MSTSFLEAVRPVQFNLGRVIVAFSPAFLVPMAWAWHLDNPALVWVWLQSMALTAGAGLLIWLATARFHRELMARDGFLLINLV